MNRLQHISSFSFIAVLLFLLAACQPVSRSDVSVTAPAGVTAAALPAVVDYNLGEATILQERFPEDSRFRNMPVRLNGIIATPTGGDGPYPVVVILHGSHHGCPELPGDGFDRWPCDPAVEQPNYRGFAYLVQHLAANGYLALSLNINAENTIGFGEPVMGERLGQIVDLHLRALAEASAGGANDFGVELAGQADLGRLAFFGHSRGGDSAQWFTQEAALYRPDSFAELGYGPVAGLLLIAPAAQQSNFETSPVPLAVILPSCDGDLSEQEGQVFVETARLAAEQSRWATSVWLERANHNYFNEILRDDSFGRLDRPDCEPILEQVPQRNFLMAYAIDFLTAIFAEDPAAVTEAKARMGLDLQSPAPAELYGFPARVVSFPELAARERLLIPASAAELATNLTGGAVIAENVTTHFCYAGFYTLADRPGSEPCLRQNLVVPGQPAHVVLDWAAPGGVWRFALPEGKGDFSAAVAFALRAGVNPLSSLNEPGLPQAFTLRLTDGNGAVVSLPVSADEPALQFPPGIVAEDMFFEAGLFTGRIPLTAIRLSLGDVTGVDWTDICEVAFVMDQTPSGSLFLGDIEFLTGRRTGDNP